MEKNNNSDEISNEIELVYYFKEISDKYRIFGDEFVKNNINKCNILIEDVIQKLESFMPNINNNEIIVIKLIGIKKITNMSHMMNHI